MKAIRAFFAKVAAIFKKAETTFEDGYTELFGAGALASLKSTVETIVVSEFGQAALSDAAPLITQVKSGSLTPATAITVLTGEISSAAESAGIQLEQSLISLVASAIYAKASGAVAAATTATAAPSAPAATS